MMLPAAADQALAAIDRYLLPAPRLRQAAVIVDGRDRQMNGQTDGRTPDRHIEPTPLTMRARLIAF